MNASNRDDIDFMPDLHAATAGGLRFHYHLILVSAALFFVVALVWAANATLDEIIVGSGKVVPSSKVQVIQNMEGGIVSEIMVSEGDLVQKGQALMRLDDTRFSSNYRETEHKYYDLVARSSRLSAEAGDKTYQPSNEVAETDPALASNQKQIYASRQAELENKLDIFRQQRAQKEQEILEVRARIEKLRAGYNYAKQELAMSEPLVKSGAMSAVDILRLQRSVSDLKGELDEATLMLPRFESALKEIAKKMEDTRFDFKTKTLGDLSEANAELAQTREVLSALKDRVTRTVVRSPVNGVVKQLKVATIGGVIQPGMDLVEIVPLEDTLLIEARIKPSDIAFLRPGLDAVVKVSAYDYSIYGGLEGSLEHIGADTISERSPETGREESYYRALVRTRKSYLGRDQGKLKIMPGMTAIVDIKTGQKTVLDYMLKPVLKIKERALREH